MSAALVAFGALALLALARSGRRRRARSGASSGAYHATTMAYAAAKLPALTTRGYTGPLAEDLHEAWRLYARELVPNVPYPAWIALGASTEGQRDVVERRPFPSGWWGIERAFITRLLRAEPSAPAFAHGDVDSLESWFESPSAQTFTAARRYRAALESLARAVRETWGADAFDLAAWGPWEYQCAVMVYSAGDGTAATVLRLARAELVRTGQWNALRAMPRSRWFTGVAAAAWQARPTQVVAWAIIRPRERFECARELAEARRDTNGIAWCAGDPSWPDAFDRAVSAEAFGGAEVSG